MTQADKLGALAVRVELVRRELEVANDVIRLGRDGEGSGRVKVATAVHRALGHINAIATTLERDQ